MKDTEKFIAQIEEKSRNGPAGILRYDQSEVPIRL